MFVKYFDRLFLCENYASANRRGFFSFPLTTFLLVVSLFHCKSTFASEDLTEKAFIKMLKRALQPVHQFSNTQEMKNYTEKIKRAYKENDVNNIINLTSKEFKYPPGTMSPIVSENFTFWCLYSRASLHQAEAKKCSQKLELFQALRLAQKTINFFKMYEKAFLKIYAENQPPATCLQMYRHRGKMCECLAMVHDIRMNLSGHDHTGDLEAIKEFLAVHEFLRNSYNIALAASNLLTSKNGSEISRCQQEMKDSIELSFAKTITLYCNQAKLLQEVTKKKEIMVLMLNLKQRLVTEEAQEQVKKQVNLVIENIKLCQLWSSRRIPPVAKKFQKYNHEVKFQSVNSSKSESLIHSICRKTRAIALFIGNKEKNIQNRHENFIKIREAILDLENFISKQLPSPKNISIDIKEVYNTLFKVLDNSTLKRKIPLCTYVFVEAGDTSGALKRLELLRTLQIKWFDQESQDNRHYRASVMNIRGDPSLLLKLEEEEAKRQAENKEQKNAALSKKIRYQFKEQQTKKRKQEINVLKETANIETKTQPQDFNNSYVNHPIGYENYSPQLSEKERRAKKQERHKIAEEGRRQALEAQQKGKQNQKITSTRSAVKTDDGIPQETTFPKIDLKRLYNLSHGPAVIEAKIQSNCWSFTRNQFQKYLEAMGCLYVPGKTNHRKLDLPDSIHVMRGDKVITILNDRGGAAILPKWGKVVPFYLIDQIQKVRENLRDLAMKAQAKQQREPF